MYWSPVAAPVALPRRSARRGAEWGVVEGGGSYDIPNETLVPMGIRNVLVAGRCLSSDREGQRSARVMGTCVALGQAAGTAASLCLASNNRSGDVRALSVERLRSVLSSQGSVLKTEF